MNAAESSEADETCAPVWVSGFNDDCDEDLLRLLFSNKARSGGGPIKNIQLDKESKSAKITFRSDSGKY